MTIAALYFPSVTANSRAHSPLCAFPPTDIESTTPIPFFTTSICAHSLAIQREKTADFCWHCPILQRPTTDRTKTIDSAAVFGNSLSRISPYPLAHAFPSTTALRIHLTHPTPSLSRHGIPEEALGCHAQLPRRRRRKEKDQNRSRW